MTLEDELRAVFDAAGCRGFLHACSLDGRAEVALDADAAVAPASVFKVLVAVEAESRFADGRLDPARPVRLDAGNRSPGPVGLSLFHDDAQVSARDLVTLMLTISDNVATDALLALVGLDAVAAAAERHGLADTRVGCDLQGLLDSVARDVGFADWAALEARDPYGEDPGLAARIRGASALQPTAPIRTTPRDMTRLLRAVWCDEAGPAAACARVRFLMQRQVTRDRLARGFAPAVTVAAKSGGLFGVLRNEIGVVTFPEGDGYAVAVFTRCDDGSADGRLVNAAIGEVAALAAGRLRAGDAGTLLA